MAKKYFDTLGVMIDMSRNAVMSPASLKRFLPILKKMGYNAVMLYTEDTYEVIGEEYFGYMRGRYSIEELKDLDAFASGIGIELIPCIQTLAHVNAAIRWGTFPVDCTDIMLVGEERTYELIERMFKTVSQCFRSRRIHIGMDEAVMLGRGKYLDKHGYENVYSIMQSHIKRVKEIASEYGYELMIWSDMYFREWNENRRYYTEEKKTVPEELLKSYDSDIIPIFWDYYHRSEEVYDAMIYNHQQLSKKTWFAGGVWTWSGFVPQISHSLETMLPAIRSCRKFGVRNVIFTLWGDFGGECSMFSALPGLHYLAEYSRGNTDEDSIKKSFKRIVGVDYDDFITLEKPNELRGEYYSKSGNRVNPAKYMLYSDVFCGYLDYTVTPGDGEHFSKVKKELHEVKNKTRKYAYLFNTAEKLCEVLEIKYELGLKTRRAYQDGNKEELKRLAETDYKALVKLMREFGDIYEKQWFYDNKPYGFDIQDFRIGGATRRIDACRRRLLDYVNGKIDSIPELAEKILPYPNATEGQPTYLMSTEKIVSASVFE